MGPPALYSPIMAAGRWKNNPVTSWSRFSGLKEIVPCSKSYCIYINSQKSPPSIKAQSAHKVKTTHLLSNNSITSCDRMASCHAVFFVFWSCHHTLWRWPAAFKGLPRCRSPPYPPKIWNPAHHQIFGGSAMIRKQFYIAQQKIFFIRRTGRLFIFYR